MENELCLPEAKTSGMCILSSWLSLVTFILFIFVYYQLLSELYCQAKCVTRSSLKSRELYSLSTSSAGPRRHATYSCSVFHLSLPGFAQSGQGREHWDCQPLDEPNEVMLSELQVPGRAGNHGTPLLKMTHRCSGWNNSQLFLRQHCARVRLIWHWLTGLSPFRSKDTFSRQFSLWDKLLSDAW